MKKCFSVLMSMIMLFCCFVVPTEATLEVIHVIYWADFGMISPRVGENPSYDIFTESVYCTDYSAEIIKWEDPNGVEIDENYEFISGTICSVYVKVTPSEGCELYEEAYCFVNGNMGTPVGEISPNEGIFKLNLYVFEANVIDMFTVALNLQEGLTGADYDDLVTILHDHVSFAPSTVTNGIQITNITDPDDTSGVIKLDNEYKLRFAVKADTGYAFSTYGFVGVVGDATDIDVWYTIDPLEEVYVIDIELHGICETAPEPPTIPTIPRVDISFNLSNKTNAVNLISSNTEHVSVKNVKIKDEDGNAVSEIGLGKYTIDFTIISDEGYALTDDTTLFIDGYKVNHDSVYQEGNQTAFDCRAKAEGVANNFFEKIIFAFENFFKSIEKFFKNIF